MWQVAWNMIFRGFVFICLCIYLLTYSFIYLFSCPPHHQYPSSPSVRSPSAVAVWMFSHMITILLLGVFPIFTPSGCVCCQSWSFTNTVVTKILHLTLRVADGLISKRKNSQKSNHPSADAQKQKASYGFAIGLAMPPWDLSLHLCEPLITHLQHNIFLIIFLTKPAIISFVDAKYIF